MTRGTQAFDEAASRAWALSVDATRLLLIEWMEARKTEPASATLTRPWCELLSNAGRFEAVGGATVASELPRRLALLVGWAREIGDSPTTLASGSLFAGWLTAAGALAASWPATDSAAWRRAVIDLSAAGNRLVRGCVALTLADSLEASVLPQPEKVALIELLRRERQATPAWPLPPAVGRSWNDADYFFAHRNRDAWDRLRETLNGIGAVSTELSKLQRLDRLREPPTDSLAKATRETIDTAAELAKLIELGRTSSPVPAEQWRGKFGPCIDAVTRCQQELLRRSPTHAARIAPLLEVLRNGAERLASGLGTEPKTPSPAAAGAESRPASSDSMPSSPRPPSTDAPLRTDAPFRTDDWPLARACTALEEAGDDRASLIARRLERWRELALGGAEGSGAEGDAGEQRGLEVARGLDVERQLLTCLTYLDEIAGERGCPAWVAPARAAVRGEVERRGVFVVLDRQLMGLKLTNVIKLAEGCGTLCVARPAPGHIARVARPGYAFATTSGIGEVLIRARVLIAEAEESR